MRTFRKKIKNLFGVNIIWGFGNHYDKTRKNTTWYICQSNDEQFKNVIHFYANQIPQNILLEYKKTKIG